MSKSSDNRERGPSCYENWFAATKDDPLQWTFEFPFYSDIGNLVGELKDGFGPYQLLNTGAFPFPKEGPVMRPVMVLRINDHLEFKPFDMDRTDTRNYHGGDLSDEIAALVSLCLGIRLKSGDLSRMFDPDGDPKGWPQLFESKNPLAFPKSIRSRVLPRVIGEYSIQELPLLCRLHELKPKGAATLIRAARMYQEALWVAEAQPEFSWLWFVSSIEVAADYHTEGEATIRSLIEIMHDIEPELVEVLQEYGGDKLVSDVAWIRRKKIAATRKFRNFILEFCPPPPENRPIDPYRTAWMTDDKRRFRKSLSIIYSHRSKALHEGIPFPFPMCESPHYENGQYSEIPTGLATQALGATWNHEDTPILLHVFEYIVRGALLNWWQAMLAENKNGE